MKALKLIPAITIILLFTTCAKEKWYNDYESFEQVLINGRWQTVTYYYEPNPENPNSLFSRKNFVNSNDKKRYHLFTADHLSYFIYQYRSYDDTCFFVDDIYNNKISCDNVEFTWEIIEDSLITHAFLLYEIDSSTININNYSRRYKIVNYSNDRINLEGERYFLQVSSNYSHDTSDSVFFDTLTVKMVWELKNIR